MRPARFHRFLPHPAAVLGISSIVLLGCARKVQIEVPGGFHGHVTVLCTGLSDNRSLILHIDANGHAAAAICPMRQTDTVVTRIGMPGPVEATILWTTTGDGIVREINFDVR